jgi:tRNA(Ile)-lysidine synthase
MIEQKFSNNCFKYLGKNYHTNKYLLAVSGGIDSMILAHLFLKSELNFAIVHCNFKLRIPDADADEQFIRDFCKKFNISFYSKSFETEQFAKEKKQSIQMAARELRYSFFTEILNSENFNFLVTAHHANDQAETILSNLIRGTGIDGLKGMRFLQSNIFRPLLNCAKSEIIAYAKENNINWREDNSNASTKYKRNAIRHKIIPEIEKLNPAFIETISVFSDKMLHTQNIYHEKIIQEKKQYFKEYNGNFYINKSFYKKLQSPNQYLFEWLKPYGFNYSQAQEVIGSITKTGKLFYSDKYVLTVDRDMLIITEQKEHFTPVSFKNIEALKENFKTQIIDKSELTNFDTNPKIAYFDFEKIKFPLTLRTWLNGDKFMPIGMKGFKKVSDFFTDMKIPRNKKESIPILTDAENNILWICGYRSDERFKISDKTKKILLLEIL